MGRCVVLAGLLAVSAPSAADDHVPRTLRMRVAQVAPEPPPPDTHGNDEVIVVTGSSLDHDVFTGRAPVSIVTRADIEASGSATIGDILQAIPAQTNGANAQVNSTGDGATRIDLRGLGPARTLVLLNGRRFVYGGSGADAAVDIDAIPLAMIERVEIAKDGASPVYGADAVSGVVDVITRKQFEGSEISLLTGISQRADGGTLDASFVRGFTTDDRSVYLTLSGGYQRHGAVMATDRAFSSVQKTYDFATKTETDIQSLAGPTGRLDASSIGTGGIQVPGCTSGVCKPNATGGWSDFTQADLYNEATDTYLYTPSTRYDVFGSGGKRLDDNTSLFTELLYSRRSSDRQLSPVPFVADAPISANNIYNPFGADILDYRRRITELGPRQYLDDARTLRLVTGIAGTVPDSWGVLDTWKYEVSVNYGDTEVQAATTGQLFKDHVADALGPSMLDANGTPICVRVPGDASTQIIYTVLGPPGSPPQKIPCVPLDILAPAGRIPASQLKNLTFSDAGVGEDRSTGLLATASGRLVELPHHGDIALAVGGDYRDDAGTQSPPSVASTGDTTDNLAQATEAEFTTIEGFGDLTIVPISDDEIARRLQFDLGGRAVHENAAGSAVTYKAGGLFRTVAGLAVRGTYSTAFRAPSFFELHGGRLQQTPDAEDPCDAKPPSVGSGTKTLAPAVQAECVAQGVPVGTVFNTAQQISEIGGNPDLKPETAGTATIGLVFEPIQGLDLTADYWHVDIHDAIEALGIETIFANCYDRAESAFCSQIHRDPSTHRISPVDQLLQNVDRAKTSGIDVAAMYDASLGSAGRVHATVEGQYLIRYDIETEQQIVHGAGFYDLGVYPRYKANVASRWTSKHGALAGFILHYLGTYKECASNDCNDAQNLGTARDVGRYFKLDVFGGYDVPLGFGKTSVQLGVNNVLDATPPVVYNAAAANSDATAYDFIGRTVYLRMAERW
ncbi:MAG TPA: TonB-dependent receptor [Kofleriaceae bacterium]|jgi:outer membrane receptor protein involved in Fe transport